MSSSIVTQPPEIEALTADRAALKVLIVDDEDLARQRIRDLLDGYPEVQILAECNNGLAATEAIHELTPDLVFLDICMPDLDGFGVIEKVGRDNMPAVIFVTAFDEHAVRAFDNAAVDYLLKPFDRVRFDRALSRALEQQRQAQVEELKRCVQKLTDLGVGSKSDYPERLAVRQSGTVHLIKVSNIDWIEAARNYVRIHCGREMHVMRDTITHIEAKLDPEQFLRIHRSTIVNIDRIRRIEPGYGSESRVELDSGTKLMISRAYRRGKVKELLQPYL